MLLTKEQYEEVDKKLNQIVEILKQAEWNETITKEVGFRLRSGGRVYVRGKSVADCKRKLVLMNLGYSNILSVEDVEG